MTGISAFQKATLATQVFPSFQQDDEEVNNIIIGQWVILDPCPGQVYEAMKGRAAEQRYFELSEGEVRQ